MTAPADSLEAPRRELRGDLFLPEFLEIASFTPHTFHILVE